jgi:hypothetical protein
MRKPCRGLGVKGIVEVKVSFCKYVVGEGLMAKVQGSVRFCLGGAVA